MSMLLAEQADMLRHGIPRQCPPAVHKLTAGQARVSVDASMNEARSASDSTSNICDAIAAVSAQAV